MTAKKKCDARNAWGNRCTKKVGHAGRHGDGEYEWPDALEDQAIRDWFDGKDDGK